MDNVLSQTGRVGVACEECRRRKRKCDGKRPTCTLCSSLQKPCTYQGVVETRKRKQWTNDYVFGLETQVASLKAHIQQLELANKATETGRPFLDTSTSLNLQSLQAMDEYYHKIAYPGAGQQRELSPLQSHTKTLPPGKLLNVAVQDVGSLIWKMHVGCLGEPAFTGPSGNFCFPSSSVKGETISPSMMDDEELLLRRHFEPCARDFKLKQSLANLFTVHVNSLHHFMHPSTQLQLDDFPSLDPSMNLLLSAVLAAGAHYSTNPSEKLAGFVFAKYAEDNALRSCHWVPSTIVVQALSILAWRELAHEGNNMAWIYNCMASGLALGLGLPVIGLQALSGPTHVVQDDDKEARIRTFWSFLLMDRMASSIMGRSCTVSWRRIEVPAFSTILGQTPTLDEVVFDHQCQLWFLHDQFMDQIYTFDFATLDISRRTSLLISARQALLSFGGSMPASIQIHLSSKSKKEVSAPLSSLLFQISYQMSLLLIHRPYLREDTQTMLFRLSLNTMMVAASKMTQYIQILQKTHYEGVAVGEEASTRLPHAPPFTAHHILTASIMHLLLGTSKDQHQKNIARRKLHICVNALSSLAVFWKEADKAISQIKDLAQRWQVVALLPIRHSNIDLIGGNTASSGNVKHRTISDYVDLWDGTQDLPELDSLMWQADENLEVFTSGMSLSVDDIYGNSYVPAYSSSNTTMSTTSQIQQFLYSTTQLESSDDGARGRQTAALDLAALQDFNELGDLSAIPDIRYLFERN